MAIQNDPEIVARWSEAVGLRKRGKTFREIADALGYADPSGAYHAVVSGLRMALRESSEDVRAIEAERLDALTAGLWELATRVPPELDALDRVLKIMDRRAKLLGLDAPTKQDVTSAGDKLSSVTFYLPENGRDVSGRETLPTDE